MTIDRQRIDRFGETTVTALYIQMSVVNALYYTSIAFSSTVIYSFSKLFSASLPQVREGITLRVGSCSMMVSIMIL